MPRSTDPIQHPDDGQLNALQAKLRERSLEIKFLRQKCENLELRIQEIQASDSWRVTAPMRTISGFLRKLLQTARRKRVANHGAVRAPGTITRNLPEELPPCDSFVLYRIIGNDLYPRHEKGQALANLRFILEHEPELEGCEKRFLLNRILDGDQERAAMDLLEERGCPYMRLPFEPSEYQKLGLDEGVLPNPGFLASEAYGSLDDAAKARLMVALYRRKNNYVMNCNGARNLALDDGRLRAKWVMPWDGNCFVTQDAWKKIRNDVVEASHKKYFIVPMARMLDNRPLLEGRPIPKPVEEPQIIFRADAAEQFNVEFHYGHRDKVELLWRLGVDGEWSGYEDDPWDQQRSPVSVDAAHVGTAGWVARLFSGMRSLEENTDSAAWQRGLARSIAIVSTLENLDGEVERTWT